MGEEFRDGLLKFDWPYPTAPISLSGGMERLSANGIQ